MTERVTDIESNRPGVVAVRNAGALAGAARIHQVASRSYSPFLNDTAGSAVYEIPLGKNWRRSDRRLNFQTIDDQVIVENTAVDRIHHGIIDPASIK